MCAGAAPAEIAFAGVRREGHDRERNLTTVSQEPQPQTPGLPSSGGFIGREREIAELRAGLEDALGGRGRLFLSVGEPGVGKTRLADELSTQAQALGVRVLWGRCWERGGAPPYWPWVQVLRACLRGMDEEKIGALYGAGTPYLGQLVPELTGRSPEASVAADASESDQERFRLFDATTTFLIEAASDGPLAIILDDLHAADLPSLHLLEFLSPEVRQGGIVLFGTYREIETRHRPRVAELLAEVGREGRTFQLAGLNEAEVGEFIGQLEGGAPSERVVQAVHHATGGNPLFVREVSRLLAAEQIQPGPAAGRPRVPIPETLRQTIRRRLEALSDRARHAIGVASATINQEFHVAPMERVLDESREDLLTAIDESVAQGIILEARDAPGKYRFSHALVRDTIYDDLPAPERLNIHRALGLALEEQSGGDPTSNLAELAYHFFQAAPLGESEKAIDYAVRAAEHAATQYAWEDAAGHFERALRALELRDPVDQERRGDLLLKLGHAMNRAGQVERARETFLRAAEVARNVDAPELLAAAALGYGKHTLAIGFSDRILVGLLEDSLQKLGGVETALRVDVMTRLALELYYSDEIERREQLSAEAVEVARNIDDPEALSYAIEAAAIATGGPDNPAERLAAGGNMLLLADQTNNRERRATAYIHRLPALLELGDIATFDQEIEAYATISAELRGAAHLWFSTMLRATRSLFGGHLEEGDQFARDALDIGERGRAEEAEQYFAMQRFTVLREQGRLEELDELEPVLRGFAQRYPMLPFHRAALALLHLDRGREAEARSELDLLARDEFANVPRNLGWLGTMALLAEVCGILRDTAHAETLYGLLEPYAERAVVVDWGIVASGSASRYLGLLASSLDRFDDAAAHLDRAIERDEQIGAWVNVAHAQRELAAALLRRDASGDGDRAIELLGAALRRAERLGMAGLTHEVASVLADLGAAPPVDGARSRPERRAAPTNIFRREGEYWSVTFEADSFRLKDSKGLRYLAKLLARPGTEMFALDLVMEGSGQAAPRPGARERAETGLEVAGPGDAGEMLDPTAKAQYKQRLEDLREELEEAEGFNDPERAARAQQEIDFLAHELSAAVGLGGRDRKAASDSERARVNVTRAIRAAVERIAEHSSALGKHFEATIRTGTFCAYTPDPRMPASWRF
jgi:tetratricopeptide (TPR) repeat protein